MKEISEETKVTLMGSKGCGLVSLSYRFLNQEKPSKDRRVMDVSFERDLEVEGVARNISLNVYIHEMDSIYQYCATSEFFFLVYSPYSKSSFLQLEEYYKSIMQYHAPTTPTSPRGAGAGAGAGSGSGDHHFHARSSSHVSTHHYHHHHNNSNNNYYPQEKYCAIVANYTSKRGVYSSMSSLALEGSEIKMEEGEALARRLGCSFFKIEDENPETVEKIFVSFLAEKKEEPQVVTLKKQSSLKKIINGIRRKSLSHDDKK